MKKRCIYPGGPCACSPHRYIRFVIPSNVPGAEPGISCRAYEAEGRPMFHSLPADVEIVRLMPPMDAKSYQPSKE